MKFLLVTLSKRLFRLLAALRQKAKEAATQRQERPRTKQTPVQKKYEFEEDEVEENAPTSEPRHIVSSNNIQYLMYF